MNKFSTMMTNQSSPLDNGAFLGLNMMPEHAERTLFVADLPRGTSYLELANLFEDKIGQCQISIKRPIFRDFYYAYVQFKTKELAKKALDEMRFPEVKGKKCRLLPYSRSNQSHMDSSGEQSSNGIFVKGFGQADWTHQNLFDAFSKFGQIQSAKVSINSDHQSRGYGYVQFEKSEDAKNAVAEMNNFELEDNKGNLSVSEYQPSKDRSIPKQPSYNNLYVKNFPDADISDEEFRKVFEQFGPIISAVIMKDDQEKSKGFGFVCFEQPEHAKQALSSLEEKGWYIKIALSKDQRMAELQKKNYQFKRSMQFLNLVVKNIDPQTTEDEIRQLFSQFGEIKNVKINAQNSTGFVCFSDREAARTAKDQTNQIQLHNRVLHVAFCEPREQRKIHLEEAYDKKAYEQRLLEKQVPTNTDQLVRTMGLLFSSILQQNQGNGYGNQMRSHSNYRNNGYQMNSNNNGAGPNMNQIQHQNQNLNQNQANGNQQYQRRQYQNNGNFRKNYNQGQNRSAGPIQNGYQNRNAYANTSAMPAPQPMMQMQQQPAPIIQNDPMVQQQQQQQPATPAMIYQSKIHSLFTSPQFQQSTQDDKKTLIGNIIFQYVEELVGNQHAPKITGMIIDLPAAQLNQSISQFELFKEKVLSALSLLQQHTSDNKIQEKVLENSQLSQTATSIQSAAV